MSEEKVKMVIEGPPIERKGKGALSSKKFKAYILAELTWKALAVLCIYYFAKDSELSMLECVVVTSIIVTNGFLEVGYLLGQSYVDRYADLGFFDMLKGKQEPSS